MYNLILKKQNLYFYLFLILFIASVLRIYQLNYQSLWVDELYSLIPTNPNNSLESIIVHCRGDQPPTHFLLLYYSFKFFPYNEITGRAISLITGLLGVISMYFLGKEFKNKNVGLFASYITALNYMHIYYSQEIRFYSLLFLLTVLSYLFFLKSYKHATFINFFFYCLFSIGLVYTHYFGPVIIICQALTFLILMLLGKRDVKFIIGGILSGLIILVAFMPWLHTIIEHTKITEFWATMPSPFFAGFYFYLYLGKDPYLAAVYVILMVLFVRHAIKASKSRSNHKYQNLDLQSTLLLLSVWVIVSYLIPYLYSVIKIPILEARYTLITLPALFIAASIGWSKVESIKVRSIIVITVFISTVINFAFFNQYYSKIRREQLREATRTVIENNKESLQVYSSMSWFYNYYFKRYNSDIKVINPTNFNAEAANLNFETDLVDTKALWVIQGHIVPPLTDQQQMYLDKYFTVKKEFLYHDAYAKLYVRK